MDARQRSNDISHNYTILARLADGTTLEQATAELDVGRGARRGRASLVPQEPRCPARSRGRADRARRSGRRSSWRPAAWHCSCSSPARTRRRCSSPGQRTGSTSSPCVPRLARRGAHFLSLAIMESLVLAFLGGLVGLMLGGWALRLLIPLLGTALPRSLAVDIDARVALVSTGLACVARARLRRDRRVPASRREPAGITQGLGPDDQRRRRRANAQRAGRSPRSRWRWSCSRRRA